jgi:DnaJ like chaperone protein
MADERTIKQAYRRLMSQHHPDKLGSEVPDEVKRRSEQRSREINAAYERIKSERGLK